MKVCYLLWLLAMSLLLPPVLAAPATTFNYQGRLLDDGAPATGVYDLEFALFSEASGGSPLTPPIVREDVFVNNGLFNVELDFGPGLFAGEKRWLAIGVRAGANTTAFFTLPMRQALASVPQSQFALVAGRVTDGSITAGMIASGAITTDKIQDGAVTAAKIAPGALITSNQVMAIILEKDGIGSGLSADFIDGIDSANLARKVDVEDRVLKDGDTMRGALTLQPFPGSQALLVHGDKTGARTEPVALIRNNNTGTNAAPAVRIEGGVLVESSIPSASKAAFEVRNTGNAQLALFGDAADRKVWIDKDGSLTAIGTVNAAGGLLTGGDAYIGGSLRVEGQVISGSVPFFRYVQSEAPPGELSIAPMVPEQPYIANEITVNVPSPGILLVSSHVAFGGISRARCVDDDNNDLTPCVPQSLIRTMFQLHRVDAAGNETLMGSHGDEKPPDVYGRDWNLLRHEVTRVVPVNAGEIRFRSTAQQASGSDSLGIYQSGIYVTYFPIP